MRSGAFPIIEYYRKAHGCSHRLVQCPMQSGGLPQKTLMAKGCLNKKTRKNGMRVDAMRLGTETIILLVSELPQNPIFIIILSDNPHLKNNKKVFS